MDMLVITCVIVNYNNKKVGRYIQLILLFIRAAITLSPFVIPSGALNLGK